MKKIITLILFIIAYSNTFAVLTQANWRWRNDDGNQTTATWKAAQNTQAVLTTKGEIWRLRLELYNTTGGSYPFIDTLQYATSTSGPWTNIDTSAGSNPFKIADTSYGIVQAEATTAQLAGTSYTFSAGKTMVDSMTLENLDLNDQQRTEVEWAILSTSNIQPNTTYYFRQQWGSSFNMDAGATYPSIVTAGVLAIRLTGFTVSREDQKIKLTWAIPAEQSNSRFEVRRSGDGKTWKTIANIKANGVASSNVYHAFDESPLSGVNYYVIKQYDADGQSYQSDVKSIKMPLLKSIISVSPNPSHSGVNFKIANRSIANVEATLSSINGTVIYHELISNVQPNVLNKLNMKQQPEPGMYILKLKGEDLSESTKIIIE